MVGVHFNSSFFIFLFANAFEKYFQTLFTFRKSWSYARFQLYKYLETCPFLVSKKRLRETDPPIRESATTLSFCDARPQRPNWTSKIAESDNFATLREETPEPRGSYPIPSFPITRSFTSTSAFGKWWFVRALQSFEIWKR